MMVDLELRCQALLHRLLMSEEYIAIHDIALENNISKRSVYYDLCKINDFLEMHQIPQVILERNRGIYLQKEQKEAIHKLWKQEERKKSLYFSPMERVKIIICTIIVVEKPLFIEDFMQTCQVSRNTIINDLKVVAAKLNEFGLALLYETKVGYTIDGDIIRKRALFFLYFPELAAFYRQDLLKMTSQEEMLQNLEKLDYIEKTLDTQYVEETLLAIASFIPFLEKSEEVITFSDVDKSKIKTSYEYKLVDKMFDGLSEDNKLYLTLHLLGSRLQTLPFDVMNIDEDQEPYDLARALVSEFMRIACVQFDNQEEIERSLFVHLKSSLYRYRYGIQLGNPLIDDIKDQYPELFEITKKAVEYVIQKIGVPINDNEIAYLTLHFGSFLAPNQEAEVMNILIVCPNGISTGNMLRGEVSALVPHADRIDVISLSELEDMKQKYTVIISTVLIDDYENSILVHPILTDADRILILKKCMRTSVKNQVEVDEIMNIVRKYVHQDSVIPLQEELKQYVERVNSIQLHPLKDSRGGMTSFLLAEHVQIVECDMDWQKAIHIAAEPLLSYGHIESRYIDAIINQTRQLGPYMFITEDVVLAHAKTEDGVNKIGLSMAIFRQEILFPKNRSAKIIFVLSAEDQVKHLKILNDIMTIFSNPNNASVLLNAQTTTEVLENISQLLNA